jgi:hypothetical protein
LLDNSDAEPIGVLTRFMRGAQMSHPSTQQGVTQ